MCCRLGVYLLSGSFSPKSLTRVLGERTTKRSSGVRYAIGIRWDRGAFAAPSRGDADGAVAVV